VSSARLRVLREGGVELADVGEALGGLRGFAGFVERGEKDADEQRDDADDDEQLHQCEAEGEAAIP